MRLPLRQWLTIDPQIDRGAGHGDHTIAIETQHRTDERNLEPGIIF